MPLPDPSLIARIKERARVRRARDQRRRETTPVIAEKVEKPAD